MKSRTKAAKSARQNLEKRAVQVEALNEILQSTLGAQSAEASAQIVLERLADLLQYPHACVLVPDLMRRELVILLRSPMPERAPARRLPLDSAGRVLAEFVLRRANQTEVIIPEDSKFAEALCAELNLERTSSFLNIPLRRGEGQMGSLILITEAPPEPDDAQLEMARQVADILAVALEQGELRQVLHTTRERLQFLAHRQSELIESERRQMTRDLHDMVGQNLTALNINLHAIANQLPPEAVPQASHSLRARIEESSSLLEEVVQRIRSMMAELRPSVLDDFGLAAALRWYGIQFSKRTEISVILEIQDIQPRLQQSVETALFRITQEALTNVAKHAHAKNVTLRLEENKQRIVLVIHDDGVGFDFPSMRRDPSKNGIGLVDMRERAEAIGGRLWVECAIGKGTRVTVEIAR